VIFFCILFLMVFWGSRAIGKHCFPSRLAERLKVFTRSHALPRNVPASLMKKQPNQIYSALSSLHLIQFVQDFFKGSRYSHLLRELPDALDLLCICMEAGLAMDAALVKVAHEMERHGSQLGSEIKHLSLSLSAGLGKEAALKQFAQRIGGDEVHALVSLLIQSERFGTSILASLRVQSDMMRERRKQKIEEQAAKMGLKMLMPLVLCHLPALFIILLGPACIQLYRVFSPFLSAVSN